MAVTRLAEAILHAWIMMHSSKREVLITPAPCAVEHKAKTLGGSASDLAWCVSKLRKWVKGGVLTVFMI